MLPKLALLTPRWAPHSLGPAGVATHVRFITRSAFRSAATIKAKSSPASSPTVVKKRVPKQLAQEQIDPSENVVSKPKTKKPAPKRLVPPTRPVNIMQLVTQNVMAELKTKQGKLSQGDARECFRIASEKYRALSGPEKDSYTHELERRREQYELEMREFLDSLTPDDYINQREYIRRRKAQGRSTNRRGIPRLDPNSPKRPMNGFMLFCADLRTNPSKFPELAEATGKSEGNEGPSVIEGSKLLASYWRSMDENLKQAYLSEGQKRSDLYKQEKAQYDAQIKSALNKAK